MKKIVSTVLLLCTFVFSYGQEKTSKTDPKKLKIGLSLAGGGAKGFAHVGVLKVLDSLGVKVDYISGTSMGAIVGGLYASGYTANDIEKIILDTDFYGLIANEKTREETSLFNKTNDKYIITVPIVDGKVNVLPKAISTGQKNIYMLKELFNNVSNVTDFSKLPIPFMCIGTNLETGKMEIFESGDLIKSIMASSAYPGLLDPVKIGDSLFIDGAMTVNYPSKPLKDKGIDFVIGVDLSQPLATRDELNSAVAILNQVIDYANVKETAHQLTYTDINIKPDLKGFNATSYGDKVTILKKGLEEGEKYTAELDQLPKRTNQYLRAPINPILSNIYKIDSISLENNKIYSRSYVQGKMGLKVPSLQTYSNINKMIDKLYATNNYKLINYDLIQEENRNILKLQVEEDKAKLFLKFGLHYDEIFKTGLLINATVKRLFFRNSTLSFDGIIGDSPRYYFNYFVDNGYIPGFGIYTSAMTLPLNNTSGSLAEEWIWLRHEAYIQSIWKDRFAIGGGISHDYYKAKEVSKSYGESENFINPYVFIRSDSRDDKDFASRGFYLDASAKLLDFIDEEIEDKVIQVQGDFQMNIPATTWLTYRMSFAGGFSLGKNINPFYQYRAGGIFGQNLGNFSNFRGLHFGSTLGNNLMVLSNDLQFKIKKNYFVNAHVDMLNTFSEINFKEAIKIQDISGGITLGFRSPFGQIKLDYSKVVDKNKGIFSIILGHWF